MHRGKDADERRRQKAFHLEQQRATRTDAEQLTILKNRPGNSEKETTRLNKKMKEMK
jgi:hypothetical protein